MAVDGATIVSGCGDGFAKCWNGHTGELRGEQRLGKGVAALAAGPFSSRVAIAAGKFLEPVPLDMRDLAAGDLKHIESRAKGINGLAVSADGRYAVSSADDGIGETWDLELLVRTGTFEIPRQTTRHTSPIALSPDARHAVFASGDTATVVDLAANRVAQRLRGHAVNVMGSR